MILFRWLKVVDQFIEKLSAYLLISSILLILFLSVFSIVARWIQLSILWVEPLVRHLVFLSTFLGGVIATGRGSHIAIDILGKYLEGKQSEGKIGAFRIIRGIISLVACLTLGWLVWASWNFVQVELEYGKAVFWGIHSGVLVAMIPFGFGLIGLRFFFQFISFLTGEHPALHTDGGEHA